LCNSKFHGRTTTEKAIGPTVPPGLLVAAGEVIE
jgi:hypothetical protein